MIGSITLLQGTGSPLLVIPDLVTFGGQLCSPHTEPADSVLTGY